MSDSSEQPATGNGTDFDLAVIGAGSAGFSAAIRAAELGAQVALIGHGTIGGTCVNVGCVPSKTLIRATEAFHQADATARFAGIRAEAVLDDWAKLIAQKDELVAELRDSKYSQLLPEYNTIAYLEGAAHLKNGGVVVGEHRIRAPKVIIATGSSAYIPPIRGIDEVPYLTSTTALDLPLLPRSLLVIGGGYIGCELAQLFSRAGVEVTIVCRRHLLPEGEPEISEALESVFRAEGIIVRTGVTYERIGRTDRGVSLSVAMDGGTGLIEAERVLIAVGRRPNIHDLDLVGVGVEETAEGAIVVDEHLRTTNTDIYAAGDVTGRDMFVYMAAYGAKLAADNALNGNARRYDASAMPSVVFTDPQVASVGLTEAEAKRQGLTVRTSVLPLSAVPRALAARDTRGLFKLVAEAESGELLGAHILAPEGADSIQTAALAIKQGMSYVELADTIFPYLTTVEGLKLAAQTFDKDVSRLSCCAG
jgi:mercuric reductase